MTVLQGQTCDLISWGEF